MPSLPKDVHVVDLSPHVNEVLTTPEAGESMLRRQIRSDCYLSSLTRSNDRRPSAPLINSRSGGERHCAGRMDFETDPYVELIPRCLPRIFECDPHLYGSTIVDNPNVSSFEGDIGSQLPFG